MKKIKMRVRCVIAVLLYFGCYVTLLPLVAIVVAIRALVAGKPFDKNFKKFARKYELGDGLELRNHKLFWREVRRAWNEG